MPNVSDVRIGAPDQAVTGAIKHAPLGTSLPELSDITVEEVDLDTAFTGNEYVSEDGLTLAPSISTTDIKDWSGATVRKVLESFDGTLSWTMISTNAGSLGIAFGAENIETEEATSEHGAQVQVALGARLPERQSFASNAAIGWQVTLSCYPDDDGNSIYIMTDDGVVAAHGASS